MLVVWLLLAGEPAIGDGVVASTPSRSSIKKALQNAPSLVRGCLRAPLTRLGKEGMVIKGYAGCSVSSPAVSPAASIFARAMA